MLEESAPRDDFKLKEPRALDIYRGGMLPGLCVNVMAVVVPSGVHNRPSVVLSPCCLTLTVLMVGSASSSALRS